MDERTRLRREIASIEETIATHSSFRDQYLVIGSTDRAAMTQELLDMYSAQLRGKRDLLAFLERSAGGEPS